MFIRVGLLGCTMKRSAPPSQRSASSSDERAVADGGDTLLDRILEGVARPRARFVLYCLAEEEPRDLDDLAAAVAGLEADDRPTAEQREQVKVAIYHNVLPKLADLQLVEYDARSKTVCFRNSPDELDEFLRLCRNLDSVPA